jgi:lysophospholipase L1-like esterase
MISNIFLAGGKRRVQWNSNTRIICDGNSITAGILGGLTYPQVLASRTPFNAVGNINNFGVSGQTTLQMSADAVAQIDSLLPVIKRQGVLISWEVTNSLYFGRTVNQAYNDFLSYCQARKAAGWVVVAVSALPRNQMKQDGSSISVYNQDLDAVNALMAANWSTFADSYLDVRTAIPQFASNPVSTSYMPDGIHLNEAGHILFVDALVPVLLSIR